MTVHIATCTIYNVMCIRCSTCAILDDVALQHCLVQHSVACQIAFFPRRFWEVCRALRGAGYTAQWLAWDTGRFAVNAGSPTQAPHNAHHWSACPLHAQSFYQPGLLRATGKGGTPANPGASWGWCKTTTGTSPPHNLVSPRKQGYPRARPQHDMQDRRH